MEKKFKLGVIGAGFMSSAIIKGVIGSNFLAPNEVLVSDVNKSNLDNISLLGVKTTLDNNEVVAFADFTLFAVKPQSLNDVFSSIKDIDSKKIISILAGVKKEKYYNYFNNTKVARCMPNTPCAISNGAIAIDLSDFKMEEDKNFIIGIFNSIASVVVTSESKLNAVTGISGSAPAYFYLFAKSLIDSGIKNGLSYEDSLNLVVNTMIGSGKMILSNKDKSLEELITAVCSKGGTTIEAIKVFNDKDFAGIIDDAVTACIKRAGELENL